MRRDTTTMVHRPTRMGSCIDEANMAVPAERTDILTEMGGLRLEMVATPPRRGGMSVAPAAAAPDRAGKTTIAASRVNNPPEEDVLLAAARDLITPGIIRGREARHRCDYQQPNPLRSGLRLLESIVRHPRPEGVTSLDRGMRKLPDHSKESGGVRGLPVIWGNQKEGERPACRPARGLMRKA
mmetsp:Transcript_18609/g.41501  ORF Transcript_18609/g.41501 Transcript_18609/m.41501 type:complete len:183 (+) Transcript_18609:1018-1566(+)